ncbi:MAG: hypothetical protein K6F93_06445 [Lachnospiraceae bacterium]|nr:hypothetical protein [Lachnospiraceae bacterium]
MPQKTDQKDKNSSVIVNRLKYFSVLLICSLLCASIFGMYVSDYGDFNIRNCIYGCAFVLSFSFLLIYYVDINKDNIFNIRSSRVVLAIIPSICLFLVHCGNIEIASCAVLLLVAFLSGCLNFTVSFLTLFMLIVYAMFFPTFVIVPSISTVLLIFAVSLLARSVFSLKNSLYCSLIIVVFYAIALVIECDFDIDSIFSLFHYILAISAILSMLGVRFLVKVMSRGISAPSTLGLKISYEEDTSMDDESSGTYLFSNKSDEDEEIVPEKYVLREDYEKLEDRLKRVYKENDELQEQLIEVNDKNNVLSVREMCSEEFMYLVRLKLDNAQVYEHSLCLAHLSKGAAEKIMCDKENAYILGIIHDAAKVLGKDYLEILENKYGVPEYYIKPLEHMSVKKVVFPVSRETGIVMLVNDMINTFEFVARNYKKITDSGEEVNLSWSGIVKNTIKVRNSQNFLRYSGFSADEVNMIKDYLIDAGGDYYQIND